ncbi:hypothetical protein DY000_02014465 [Brassica cretica]|uniref:Uncharacterized protein n=1 Tax=Brassica cretica TaxID=69181 RepID=A0ABQ7D258_BRACR|nr:hypothetical protein DY000_02014465 [Brassica cretica]
MALSLDLLDEKREAARLRNWSYQQDVARTYNKKVRTRTFQQGDWVIEVRRAGAYGLQDSKGTYELNQVSRDLRSWLTLTKSGMTTVARPQRIKTGTNLNPASPDVESSVSLALGSFHPHQHPLSLSVTSCRSRIQHRNSIVASFRVAECEIQTGRTFGFPHSLRVPFKESQDLRKNLRVPMWPQGSKDKRSQNLCAAKGASGSLQLQRTSGFQPAISGSKSLGSNTASKAKYDYRKKDRTPVQPRAHRGRYIPKGPPGSHTTSGSKYTRVPIRSPDLREKPGTSGSQTRSKDPKRAFAPPPRPPSSQSTLESPHNLQITKAVSRLQEVPTPKSPILKNAPCYLSRKEIINEGTALETKLVQGQKGPLRRS